MRTSPPRLLFVIFLLLVPVAASAQTYNAVLLGTNETTNCDPDGTGNATVVFNGNSVSYAITVNNVSPPTMQHIHIGAAGTNGIIVINLPGTWAGNSLSGSTTADPAVVAQIHANPAGYYLNVHNGPCPGGVVRGQLQFVSAATTIPTLSTWTLIAMIGVLAIAGLIAVRKF